MRARLSNIGRKLGSGALTLFQRPHRYWLFAIMLAALANYGWTEITRTRGAQIVSFDPAEQECSTDGSFRYCINRDRRGTNGDIVYHLHGRNLDETIWNDNTYMTAMVQGEWQRSSALPPIVVSVSYGATWLLSPKGEKADSGLLEDFMTRLPAIEKKIGEPRRRILMGESMGGLNVLIAGLSYPAQFDKVAALCPGVYKLSPFGSLTTMRMAMHRTGANPQNAFGVWLMARNYVANEAEWRRISPVELIENAGPDSPSLYLSNGIYDGFGNFEGTQRLAEVAQQRGIETQWHPIYGGHCSSDMSSLAAFLIS